MISSANLIDLLLSILAGGLVGLERQLHDKPAGFRTNIMICFGAALFTLLSIRIPEHYLADVPGRIGDPTRIAAQIVTGVGFLGAGSIIHARGGVRGLTTAASIWVVAAIGMAFGAGFRWVGLLAASGTAVILFAFATIESWIIRYYTTVRLHIKTIASEDAAERVERLLRESGLKMRYRHFQKTLEGYSYDVSLVGAEDDLLRIQQALIHDKDIRSVKRT